MEGKKAVTNLNRVFLSEDVSGPNAGTISKPFEGDESPPRLVPAKKIQTGTPPSIVEVHAP